jgi:hypothetical protein
LKRLKSKNPNWQQDRQAREWAFRVESMKNTLQNLINLETSRQVYAIRDTSLQYGNTQYRLKDSVIELLVGSAANFVHESAHGGHFETRDLMYINNALKEYAPPFGNDQWDEIAAYRAEYAFKPDEVKKLPSPKKINTADDIDNEWLLGLKQGNKTVYHPEDSAHVVAVRINVDSPGDSVIKAYYFLPGIGSWKDNYASIRDNKLIIYKH